MLQLHEQDVGTSQGFQSQASVMIIVLTIHLVEERQCDPNLSFLFKQHDSHDGEETRDQVT